jgi:hypothetical protein
MWCECAPLDPFFHERGGEAGAGGSGVVVNAIRPDLIEDLAISPRSFAEEARDLTSQSIVVQ